MGAAIAALRAQHREIEKWLDELPAPSVFAEAWRLLAAHYTCETAFFDALRPTSPALVGKMEDQHAYARELAGHLADGFDEGLARRFHAIAQHNIIEEERDLFPLAERWLPESEQRRLASLIG